jgi:hypothetical protein
MSILVVINKRVALDGVDLSDEKAIGMKIRSPDHEVFGLESLRVRHGFLRFRFKLSCCSCDWCGV